MPLANAADDTTTLGDLLKAQMADPVADLAYFAEHAALAVTHAQNALDVIHGLNVAGRLLLDDGLARSAATQTNLRAGLKALRHAHLAALAFGRPGHANGLELGRLALAGALEAILEDAEQQ